MSQQLKRPARSPHTVGTQDQETSQVPTGQWGVRISRPARSPHDSGESGSGDPPGPQDSGHLWALEKEGRSWCECHWKSRFCDIWRTFQFWGTYIIENQDKADIIFNLSSEPSYCLESTEGGLQALTQAQLPLPGMWNAGSFPDTPSKGYQKQNHHKITQKH